MTTKRLVSVVNVEHLGVCSSYRVYETNRTGHRRKTQTDMCGWVVVFVCVGARARVQVCM